jgi:competence protein ComEC
VSARTPVDVPAPHVLVAALCAGLALASATRPPVVALGVAGVALAGLAVACEPGRIVALALALLACGWCWGSVRLDALDQSVLAPEIGSAALARVEVAGPARRSTYSVRMPVQVRSFAGRRRSERAWLELPPARAPPQGAVLELVASVRAPRGPEPGSSFDESAYLRRQGIHVVLRAPSFRVVGRRGGIAGLADGFRAQLDRTIAPGLAGERRAVLAGVVLGEDEGLSPELRDAFRASGLYHLLAVSGQNIAFVVAGALLLAWLAGLPRWAAEVGALLAIAAYVLAVGWQPSVVRAGVAGALASLAWLVSRPADRWYFLLVGATVLLAWNPYALRDPGFQLSFAAVAGIFLLLPRIEARLAGYPAPRLVAAGIALSVACGLATAPILWLQFGAIPAYSIVSNALAAPMVAPLFGLALLTAALAPVVPDAAAALAWCDGWLAAYVAACARAVGGLPGAQVESPLALAAIAGIVLGTVALGRVPPPHRVRAATAVCLAAAAGLGTGAVLRTHVEELPPPRGLRMIVLDVGQGDATLLQVPEGAVLIDEGPPEARVDEQLRRLGVERLALLVLTHPSRDNIGGAEAIVRELDVERVVHADLSFADPFGEPVLREARRRGIPITVARSGVTFRLGRLILRVVWPPDGRRRSDDTNDHATVIAASYGSIDTLLPADAEANVTGELGLGRMEILKVAHHGSEDPLLGELLEELRPRLGLISAGAGNEYGHPRPATLAELAAAPGLEVRRTDRDGRIVVETDGAQISVETQR